MTNAMGVSVDGDLTVTIRRTWMDVLRVPEVTDDDDFFAAGGHSMLASRLMSRLRKALGQQLPVAVIFDHPVFADFVDQVRQCLATEGPAGLAATGRTAGPVSSQQRELLVMENVLGPSPVNNVVVALLANQPVDPELLREALRTVQNRHPALRLRFPGNDEQAFGPPLDLSDVELMVVAAGTDAEVRAAVRKAYLRPHDLERGNLVRAQLFHTARRDVVVLHLHHLSVDGLSQEILLDDLTAAYDAQAVGVPQDPEPEELSYLDYASWQRAEHADLLARSRTHWRQVVELLGENARQERPSARGTRFRRGVSVLPTGRGEELRALARAEGATEFVAFASAVAAAVARSAGQARVGVGTLLDNRSHTGFERTVGAFATSTLLAVDVAGAGTPRELVRQVRAELVEARRWAEAPLVSLLDLPCAERGLNPDELVDVVVAVETPYRPDPTEGLSLTPVFDHEAPLVNATVGAPLTVTLAVLEDGGVRVSVEDSEADQSSVDDMAAAVTGVLDEFAAAPDAVLSVREEAGQR